MDSYFSYNSNISCSLHRQNSSLKSTVTVLKIQQEFAVFYCAVAVVAAMAAVAIVVLWLLLLLLLG